MKPGKIIGRIIRPFTRRSKRLEQAPVIDTPQAVVVHTRGSQAGSAPRTTHSHRRQNGRQHRRRAARGGYR